MTREGITRVVYLCTADATRMVTREANRHLFKGDRDRLITITAFDKRGTWIDQSGRFPTEWTSTEVAAADSNELLEPHIIRARSVDGHRPVPAGRLF
jgi:hypothetical protein